MIKIAIIGANGYTGLELMKLIATHPQSQLVTAQSRSNAGTKISDMYPALYQFYANKTFDDVDLNIAATCDVAFTALPHAASADIGGKLFDLGVKVIDLSADFRYNNIELYEKTYNVTHPRPQLNANAVYGLSELFAESIKNAKIVGNPGCYTTCSIMPLYPLIKDKLISDTGIIIDAKSGISGAGRKADIDYSFCEADSNFKAYGVTTHRHTTEIEEKLSLYSNVALSFTPHLLPVKRGILSTIYANLATDTTADKITACYAKYYGNAPFVSVLPSTKLPELKSVVGSNNISIGFVVDNRLGRVIIVSCLDNLLKGASGQAVQNMNIMFGLNQTLGLPKTALHL